MNHKSQIIHNKEGGVYSLAIKLSPEEVIKTLGYFENRIDGEVDGFKYVSKQGLENGVLVEVVFLRELLHRIEFDITPSISPQREPKKLRRKKRATRRIKR